MTGNPMSLGRVQPESTKWQAMPTFRIRVINTDFDSSNEINQPSEDQARAEAVKTALQIGVDEVCKGTPFFGAEVRLESGSETLERMVVAIGVSPLR
jgi:hypothetical protein